MATKEMVTKVWIEPGCIVCDACETAAPDVFEVLDDTCIIRPAALTAEFIDSGGNSLDTDLALLIDTCNPDRNRNGISGFTDTNRNGVWNSGEAFTDYDVARSLNRDQVLGYRDGIIDRKDLYGKVRGKLVFKTSSGAWTSAQGSLATKLRGPIRPGDGEAPRTFSASDRLAGLGFRFDLHRVGDVIDDRSATSPRCSRS